MSAIEVVNRNILTNLLLDKGYNVFLPVMDRGIDLIAHRETDGDVKLIQLKSRWTINRKYERRNIWIAFPDDGDWYLAPHDWMVGTAGAGVLSSKSWREGGAYSRGSLSEDQRGAMSPLRISQDAHD